MAQGKHKSTASPIGLGTVIAKITAKLGIPHCASCEERRQFLDRKVPNIWCLRCRERNKPAGQTQPGKGKRISP